MAQALPLTKITGLLIKTLAKPLSKSIKHQFARSPYASRMLIGIGQMSHQFSSRMTIWSAGYRVRRITPLEEEKALKEGAEMVGEGFILGVSLGWLFFEYNRSKEKELKTEIKRRAATKAERDALRAKLKALDLRVKALEDVQVPPSGRGTLLGVGGSRSYIPPKDEDLVPIQDDDSTGTDDEEGRNSFVVAGSSGRKSANERSSTTSFSEVDGDTSEGRRSEQSKHPAQVTKSWWKFW